MASSKGPSQVVDDLLRISCTAGRAGGAGEGGVVGVVGVVGVAGRMPGPLEGIKVLDFTVYINGPKATQTMAENGATVRHQTPRTPPAHRHPSRTPGPH